jgi:pilus assembly protein Flp/PilA
MRTFIQMLKNDRKGATAIEYGLIAGLVAVVIIGGVTAVGGKLSNLFNNVSAAIPDSAAPAK